MQVRVKWVEGMAFIGESGSGHGIVIDGPPDLGGRDLGMRPMELMLMSVGACSAVDVVHILRKARQPVLDCYVEVQGKRAQTEPKVFTDIHLHFVLIGKQLKASQVERAVNLSADKYCSAALMLSKAANVTHDFELRSPE